MYGVCVKYFLAYSKEQNARNILTPTIAIAMANIFPYRGELAIAKSAHLFTCTDFFGQGRLANPVQSVFHHYVNQLFQNR